MPGQPEGDTLTERPPPTPPPPSCACSYAVRRVAWSPHAETLLASCSYDMSVKLWDTAAPQGPLVKRWVLQWGLIASHYDQTGSRTISCE